MFFPSICVFCICFLRNFRSLQVKPAFPPSALMCLFHPGHAVLNARPNTNSLSCHLKSSHSTTQVYLHPENQVLHDFSVAGCIIPLPVFRDWKFAVILACFTTQWRQEYLCCLEKRTQMKPRTVFRHKAQTLCPPCVTISSRALTSVSSFSTMTKRQACLM